MQRRWSSPYIFSTIEPSNNLFLPNLGQFGNIRIIDTPGIGSLFKHNTDAAIQRLPEIGLALMAISAERPLAEDDLLLLKDIKRYSAEIKIIITKTDQNVRCKII